MSTEADNQDSWGSRKILLSAMLCQTLGANTIILLPHDAIVFGGAGHVLLYSIIYIFFGIPLMYMEYVTGQFTGRNCLEIWRVRPCLSHLAYVQIFWQIMNIIINHLFCSFMLHYFLISFEEPIPYYTCGSWSNADCNIIYYNYTIHQDCLTPKRRLPYCAQLCRTFPEYQYWRYYLLGVNREGFYVAWRITLASGLICLLLFITCFRITQTYKSVIGFYVIFLISSRCILLVGSLLQKGIVVKFEEAMDNDFSLFLKYVEFSACVVEVLFSLNVGSGISFNLSSSSSFRSPCYSNTVIVVIITAAMTILGIFTHAMMLCPYSFKYGVHPFDVVKYPMFISYEMIPRLLYDYEQKSFWLILCYSLIAVSFLCINTIIISSLIQIFIKKYSKVSNYPGLITVVVVSSLFVISIPLLGNKSLYFMIDIQRSLNFLLIFLLLVECFIFLLCYGMGKFSEDIHFMLGVQPQVFVKLFWIISIFVLIYGFCMELYAVYKTRYRSLSTLVGWWLLVMTITLTLLAVIIRVLKAAYKKKLKEEVGIESNWGPKSDVLKRSRTMFTTHAMTKEYMYRQYHLQAGILMRQKRCNIRV